MKLRLSAVSVVEDRDGELTLACFPDTPAGNREAEKVFRAICKANYISDEDIVEGLELNYAEDGGTWQLYIVHSE